MDLLIFVVGVLILLGGNFGFHVLKNIDFENGRYDRGKLYTNIGLVSGLLLVGFIIVYWPGMPLGWNIRDVILLTAGFLGMLAETLLAMHYDPHHGL